MGDEIERPVYWAGQRLGAEDFNAEQRYHRDALRRHALGPHTWGVVSGLELLQFPIPGDPLAVEIVLAPGQAIDGFGRTITVLEPYSLDTSLFAGDTTARTVPVWIRWARDPSGRRDDDPCLEDERRARLVETFEVLLGPLDRHRFLAEHDPLRVGSASAPGDVFPPERPAHLMPHDTSLPHQRFPADGDLDLWLVQIGSVAIDGRGARYVSLRETQLVEGRRYAGFVGASIGVPGGTLLVRDRTLAGAAPDAPTRLVVEGYAQVGSDRARGDLDLHDAAIRFRKNDGGGARIDVRRTEGTPELLDIELGAADGTGHELRVGPLVGGAISPILRVTDAPATFLRGPLTVDGAASISGDVTLGANLVVTGEQSLGGSLTVGGNVDATGNGSFDGSLEVGGDASVGGALEVTTNAHIGGELSVDGPLDLSGAPDDAISFGSALSIGRSGGGLRLTAPRTVFRAGASDVATLDSSGLRARLSHLDLSMRHELTLSPQPVSTVYGPIMPLTGSAVTLMSTAIQAVYIEVQITVATTTDHLNVEVRLRSAGALAGERRFHIESKQARSGSGIVSITNDHSYFVWMPRPTNTYQPFEYMFVAGAAATVTMHLALVGVL